MGEWSAAKVWKEEIAEEAHALNHAGRRPLAGALERSPCRRRKSRLAQVGAQQAGAGRWAAGAGSALRRFAFPDPRRLAGCRWARRARRVRAGWNVKVTGLVVSSPTRSETPVRRPSRALVALAASTHPSRRRGRAAAASCQRQPWMRHLFDARSISRHQVRPVREIGASDRTRPSPHASGIVTSILRRREDAGGSRSQAPATPRCTVAAAVERRRMRARRFWLRPPSEITPDSSRPPATFSIRSHARTAASIVTRSTMQSAEAVAGSVDCGCRSDGHGVAAAQHGRPRRGLEEHVDGRVGKPPGRTAAHDAREAMIACRPRARADAGQVSVGDDVTYIAREGRSAEIEERKLLT